MPSGHGHLIYLYDRDDRFQQVVEYQVVRRTQILGSCMNDDMTPHEAAELATHQLGQAVRLIDRFDLGAEGAYRVTIGGVPGVFKYWSGTSASELRLATAVAAHGVLHRSGWPVPAIHFWRSDASFAFVMEAQMSGHRVDSVTETLCSQLLTLLDAVPKGTDSIDTDPDAWVTSLEQSLYHNLPTSPCRPLALLRTPVGQRIVIRARKAFSIACPVLVAARDVIHGDFSAGNILCDDAGELAAILDWQHSGVGHHGFDLIGLEWDLALRLNVGSAASLALVSARVEELVEESVREFCRAYYGVWNLSWALDTPDEEAVLRAADAVGIA